MKRFFKLTVVFCWFFFMTEHAAFAYIDPGTGSLFLQLLLGGIAGLAVIAKLYWNRLLSFFGISHQDESIDEAPSQKPESSDQKNREPTNNKQ